MKQGKNCSQNIGAIKSTYRRRRRQEEGARQREREREAGGRANAAEKDVVCILAKCVENCAPPLVISPFREQEQGRSRAREAAGAVAIAGAGAKGPNAKQFLSEFVQHVRARTKAITQ